VSWASCIIWRKADCKIWIIPDHETQELTYDSALIDGRVGWTIPKGREIVIGYASEAEIKYWGDVELADIPALREKVAELNANGIRTKFVFVKPPGVNDTQAT
jgi:hypothetical protein